MALRTARLDDARGGLPTPTSAMRIGKRHRSETLVLKFTSVKDGHVVAATGNFSKMEKFGAASFFQENGRSSEHGNDS